MITIKDYRNVMDLVYDFQISILDYSVSGNYDKVQDISRSISDYLLKLVDFDQEKEVCHD